MPLFLSATTRSLILEHDLRSKGELDYMKNDPGQFGKTSCTFFQEISESLVTLIKKVAKNCRVQCKRALMSKTKTKIKLFISGQSQPKKRKWESEFKAKRTACNKHGKLRVSQVTCGISFTPDRWKKKRSVHPDWLEHFCTFFYIFD